MSEVSLTAAMRHNLLNLQNIASQRNIIQNRLATGLKVSSATDNPSSYYTASALNNRAADLTALLDAMSQSIQTLRAASEGLETGIKFLEQAKAVATAAFEKSQPITALVSSEQELLAAIDSGKKGLIVINNDITLSENQSLRLKDGQSLVGAQYFNKNAPQTKLTFDLSPGGGGNAIIAGNSSLIAGLSIDFTSAYDNDPFVAAIYADSVVNVRVQDVNLKVASTSNTAGFFGVFGIVGINGAEIDISGQNKIELSGYRALGIFAHKSSRIEINGQTDFILEDGIGWGIWSHSQSTININSQAVLNLKNSTSQYCTLLLTSRAFLHVFSGASISATNDSGDKFRPLKNEYGSESGNEKTGLLIEHGVNISIKNSVDGTNFGGICKTDFFMDHEEQYLTNPNDNPDNFAFTGSAQTYQLSTGNKSPDTRDPQYDSILAQYDSLMNDAFYKGIDLLTGQNLKIAFNENRSSKIELRGIRADSCSLGVKTLEWHSQEDIEKSISELEEAINSLRNTASQFGNYYSIVTTRQKFTENLINILEEGADKLTLADINQEAANMLTVQTSQQLATNSLFLTSQASRAVLRLF